jgi:hypothetical protein
MAKNFANCVAEAVRGGILSEQEGKDALSLYRAVRAAGGDDAKAKGAVSEELAREARERERRSVLTAARIADIQKEVGAFTSAAGEKDLPKAWQMLHDRRGDEGKFVGPQDGKFGLSVEELKFGILSKVMEDLEAVTHEFRRGAFWGDLRTQSKALAKVSPGARAAQADGEADARREERAAALRGPMQLLRCARALPPGNVRGALGSSSTRRSHVGCRDYVNANERPLAALLLRIGRHHVEIRSHMRRKVSLVDD